MGRFAAVSLLVPLLAACGPSEPPPAPEDTVYGDQVKALDKARSLQDDVNARKEELDERMKQDDGG